jgi:hypothetical protein
MRHSEMVTQITLAATVVGAVLVASAVLYQQKAERQRIKSKLQ